jgi:hypothetical protein
MIQFINPVSGSRLIDVPGSKSVKITTNYGDRIVSPYVGVVQDVTNDSVTIYHNVNNQNVYSKFTGIHRPQVSVNVPLKQGESFAYGDATDIEYSILNDNGKKISVVPYFQGINTNSSTNNSNKGNGNPSNSDSDNDKTDNDKRPQPKAGKSYIADFFTDIALKPFKVVHKPMQKGLDKLSGKKSDDENLNEQIDRIKQLLK